MDVQQAPGFHDNSSVVVNDLDLVRIAVMPAEADSPLVVDANTPLATEISLQGLQAITGRCHQRRQVSCCIEHAELTANQLLDVLREPA